MGKHKNKKITSMQKRFCREYLMQGEINATEAARKAGYAVKWADRAAYLLLSYPRVQKFISMQKREVMDAADLTPELVMESIARGVRRGNSEMTKLAARMLNIEDGIKDPNKKRPTLKYNLDKEPTNEGDE